MAAPPLPPIFTDAMQGKLSNIVEAITHLEAEEQMSILNQVDYKGATLLHWACYRGQYDVVEYLLAKGVDTSIRTITEGHLPIHWAAAYGNVRILHLLFKNKVDLNEKDTKGYTPVTTAVQNVNMEALYYLHRQGASMDELDNEGCNTLHWAVIKNNLSIILYLLAAGVSPLIQDKRGFLPIHWAIHLRHNEVGNELLRHPYGHYKGITTRPGFQWMKDLQMESSVTYDMLTRRNNDNLTALEMAEQKDPIMAKRISDRMAQFKHVIPYDKAPAFWFLVPFAVYGLVIPCLIYTHIVVTIGVLAAFLTLLYIVATASCHNHTQKNTIVIGIFWSSYSGLLLYYYLEIFPAWAAESWWAYVVFLSILCGLLLQGHVMFTDPGIVVKDKEAEFEAFMEGLSVGKHYKICSTCQIRKSVRSKHCRVTNRCIVRFDHYCAWIINSVGIKNHLRFLVMLLWAMFNHLLMLWMVYRSWDDFWPENGGALDYLGVIWEDNLKFAVALFQIVNFLWELQLAVTQIKGVFTNLTFNEEMHAHSYGIFNRNGAFFNPFNMGWYRNLKYFFTMSDTKELYDIYQEIEMEDA